MANPHRFWPAIGEKFGLAPTPLRLFTPPGWSAQRHRRGRAMRSIANGSAKFSAPKLDQVLPLTATANGYEPTTKKLVLGRAPRRPPTAFAALRGRAMQSIAKLLCETARPLSPKTTALQRRAGQTPPTREARTASFIASLYPNRAPARTNEHCLRAGFRESPPAGFAEKTPAFVCRAAPRAAGGGGDSRDPTGRNCPTGRPILGRPARKTAPPNELCPRAWGNTSVSTHR